MTVAITHTTVTGAAADSTALVDGPAWDAAHTMTGVISASQGGTGIVNNDASTLTISGSFGTTFTVSAATSLTLPTTGTLATLAGTEELTNKTLTSSVAKGTWTASGTWTIPAVTLGGTVSGGGNQINNVIVGTSTPLAGSFTTLAASTSVTSPIHIGGSGTTSTAILRSTSGSGTTGADIIFQTGNGGLTENCRMPNGGGFLCGTASAFVVGTVTPTMQLSGTAGAGSFGIFRATTPGAGGGLVVLSSSRGTSSSPVVLQNNDGIGSFIFSGDNGTNLNQQSASIVGTVDAIPSGSSVPGRITFNTTAAGNTSTTEAMRITSAQGVTIGPFATDPGAGALLATASVKSSGATAGIGYATGAGGTVAQGTNRTTGVTLNTVTGAITLFSQVNTAVSLATAQTFTLTNSAIAAADVVHVSQKSGTDKYHAFVTNTAAGSCQITNYTTGGTTNEAPVFSFAVIKGVTS